MPKAKRKATLDTVWRYMSVAELIGILERRRLVFHQFRKLRRHDRREGAIPNDLYERDPILTGNPAAQLAGIRANEDIRFSTYVQCWHRATREHSAFWQIYGNRGVALRSGIRLLKKQDFWTDLALQGEEIIYADTWAQAEKQGLSVPQGITPNRSSLRLKRRAFSWEKEWRVFYRPPAKGFIDGRLPSAARELERKELLSRWPAFEEISINSFDWISVILVAPAAPKWVAASISALAGRHNVRCMKSKI
ncbi:MAG: hypothetical protein ACREIF_13715 [Chthoniobacterales bacterium]